VRVAAGQPETVEARLVSTDAAFGTSGRTLRRAGIITMAAGTPLIATGAALWLVGRQKKSDADSLSGPAHNDQVLKGSRMQQWGLVSGVVGVTALATGFVLWWTGNSADPDSSDSLPGDDQTSPDEPAPKVRLSPVLTVDYVGVTAQF
jgi:hypothetical protein